MSNNGPLDVAVIGVGRMGRHHARTYAAMPQANLVAVVDADGERAATVADEYGCRAFTTTDQLLREYPNLPGVTVAVPTQYHQSAAEPLLQRGIACLIEKPLAPTMQQARHLAELAATCGAVLQVGHTERFNPAVRAVAAMDLTARYIEVDRVSPMTFRSLDVGVVMDMMIHDLDIVLMLARSPIKKVDATGVAVLGEHEDIANARIVFESGCVAAITASRLAFKTQRKLRLFSEDAYVSLDYQARNGTAIRRTPGNVDALNNLRSELAAGRDLSDLDWSRIVSIENLTMDLPPAEQDPLTAELGSFLDAVRTGAAPLVDAEAGYFAVAAAERVVEAIRDHEWKGLAKKFE
ncbi:MAG: Gfo/Idh/MocA family oxidoreductase [Phycisphaeraceae bacterium]|nr:Gfo/Idh/MocA family oxidoreductase [Phycisphaeraceae bacterium]